ncbi:L-lactate dehydrogenase [Clostridium tertium]|jgi:L-lactate dehydrogenase|uniref:L-lactate dehydrogenase n=1 Tax=Clostridium tertium TaxID=1559 RepID=A0A9X4AYL9_9CLOT|nr:MULTISPECIES: L-lactate dehydrogenase [Clostridium]EEH97258.1 L-lactate dehydrogenase [Clostridium sp. 7_2_43FAA]MBP1867305.1 L-lactate dehydrogenase [Clostridium tertium]MBU6134789.1 L-lactate dehydrogenase [Clostridium tertium]MDB1942592.1 L-lactate dehydrogenase [Clostridium tertium]MDB1945553.1 L-lactate dehydrogenase [Clostridium tertium]
MSKISIIGAGSIGATTAFALLQKEVAREIVINDINQEKALGEVLDLMHGSSLNSPCNVTLGALEDTKDSDIIIITAGVAQKPGETRLDLVDKNYKIFKSFVPTIAKLSPNAILLVVSNPVDILAYMTYKLSGFPKERVIGSGTVLDTTRLRSLLGKYFGIDGRIVQGYVLGEHGDSEFVPWSSLTIGNIPIKDFSEQLKIEWDEATEKVIADDVKNAAYEVINRKGATAFSVAAVLTRIVEAFLKDEKTVLSVSTLLNDYLGVNNTYLSVPTIVGKNGVEKVLNIELSKEEKDKFVSSAKIMKEYIDRINNN